MEDYTLQRNMLIDAITQATVKTARERVPEKGVFRQVCYAMTYFGTPHKGRIYLQYSPEAGCILRASMIPHGTDREISNYLFSGTRDQCLQWLERAETRGELLEIYNHLAQRADEG